MRQRLAAIAAALALLAAPAAAETPIGYSEDGRTLFSVSLPDFWSARTGGPRVIDGPDGEGPRAVPRVLAVEPTAERNAWMGFLSPPGVATLAEGREYLREVSRFLAFEPEVRETQTRRIGGLPAEVFSGTGRREGRDIQFSVALIDLPGARVAVAAAVVEAGAGAQVFDGVNAIFDSFRAAR